MYHAQDDFWISSCFDPIFIAHIMHNGFLPIATESQGVVYLLPKLHEQRCVIDPRDLHVPKQIRKKANAYRLTVNQAFDQVVQGCHDQHGVAWLYPPVVSSFRQLVDGVSVNGTDVKLYSIELWKGTTLVAGELGYCNGAMFTSLTGFYATGSKGAGTMQLYALGALLHASGFQLWDLGMSIDYKLKLGAKDIPRDEFVKHVHTLRSARGKCERPPTTVLRRDLYHISDIMQQVQQPHARKVPSVIYDRSTTSSERREITHATLGRLVAKLTDAQHHDTDFRNCFLLTYRSHSSVNDFIMKLTKRYTAASSLANPRYDDCDPSNADDNRFSVSSDSTVQAAANVSMMRAMSVLKFWIRESGFIEADLDNDRRSQGRSSFGTPRSESAEESSPKAAARQPHPIDDNDAALAANTAAKLKINRSVSTDSVPMKPQVTIRAYPTHYDPDLHRIDIDTTRPAFSAPPLSISRGKTMPPVSTTAQLSAAPVDGLMQAPLTRSVSDNTRDRGVFCMPRSEPFGGMTAQDAADQLTLLEQHNFHRIDHRELTNKNWTTEFKHDVAPNVMALIELEILHPKLQAVQRANMVAFFIDVAEACYRLNNFNTHAEIVVALTAPCIKQLETTWNLVAPGHLETFEHLKHAFAAAEGLPRLPSIFIVVKDIFGFEESMRTTENGLIHFQKIRKTGTELFWLAKKANKQESVLFVNSLADAGFM
ncbi:hypothetical protein DYB36_001033 [Aphanomyces astaci]|uniref:Ras-GEF domain-containing protein n=1 Tax=Aphanomyces astaci TaxID=112090 RepID=A0A397A8V0_APHAT|nr:hypothetical protein DYB36_001033 [Aphanomyces astaci]